MSAGSFELEMSATSSVDLLPAVATPNPGFLPRAHENPSTASAGTRNAVADARPMRAVQVFLCPHVSPQHR